jgi:hypothetical protein
MPIVKKKLAKEPRQYVGKNQLKALLDMKKQLTIEDIAKRLKTTPEIVRRYIQRYGL